MDADHDGYELDTWIFEIVNGSRDSPVPPSSDLVIVDEESKKSDC